VCRRDRARIAYIRCRDRHRRRRFRRPRRDRLACPRIRTRAENLFGHLCRRRVPIAAQLTCNIIIII